MWLMCRVKELKEKELSRELKRKPTLFSRRDQETSDSETTSSLPETSPDSLNGPNTSPSKGKKESSWQDSKSQQLSLSSPEPLKRTAVRYWFILASVLFKLLRKYTPEDSKQKKARLVEEAKVKAESNIIPKMQRKFSIRWDHSI